MLEIGSLVDGKYRILNKVGQGGMSVVYMAMNERANKTWAIKEVRKDGSQNFDVVKQGLIVETDMLKRLNHSHLPSIIDVIDGKDSFLIVMDFIEGKTLKNIIDEYGPQPQESVVDWAKQLCGVLGYLHSRHPAIVYRDMKPSNVMLKPDGNVVLFDFGTAREYKAQSIEDTTCLGTKGYAAPEQYGGHGQTDARTDIYCLGATMYHLLTAHNPGEPPYEMYPVRQWNPALSAGLEAIILKCTQNNPADRYQSCAELLYALDHYWEWDVEYRKKQNQKFRKFVIPVSLSLACGLGAIIFRNLEIHTMNSSYTAYIETAAGATVKDKQVELCRKAIELDPVQSDAYMQLLTDVYLADNKLTKEETEELSGILISSGSGSTNFETQFKNGNPEGYDQFAYELGIACYYKYYNNELDTEASANGRNTAKTYLKCASESTYLDGRKTKRAECLYKITNYYNKLGLVDATGDSQASYADYWNDMVGLLSDNLVEGDNANTAILMYKEMVAAIISSSVSFRNEGITREQMEAELALIKEHLNNDFNSVEGTNKGFVDEQLAILQANIEKAYTQIKNVFQNSEQGGTE